MEIPFEPVVFNTTLNVHLFLEYLAFLIGFQYYVRLRKKAQDVISNSNRLSILIGAVVGAWLGSRIMAFFENPVSPETVADFFVLLNSKTIMGGLFGGLIGVEVSKKIIGEVNSSGDLFTLPLIIAILIGRIGCFLSGINEFTYGIETPFWVGMDLGDGISRHPIALYEILFLLFLFLLLKPIYGKGAIENGMLFKYFMLAYFGFRFVIEFLKPNVFFLFGLSSIQWLCIVCYMYYFGTVRRLLKNAYKKIHLLRFHP